jgi:hypothetical protein
MLAAQIIEVGAAEMRAVAGELMRRNTASKPGGQTGSLAAARPGTEVPGMKTARLARRLGLDGNPLRRHAGKFAARMVLNWRWGEDERS